MKEKLNQLKTKTKTFINNIDVQQVVIFGSTATAIVLGAKYYTQKREMQGLEPAALWLPNEAWEHADKAHIRLKNGDKYSVSGPLTPD